MRSQLTSLDFDEITLINFFLKWHLWRDSWDFLVHQKSQFCWIWVHITQSIIRALYTSCFTSGSLSIDWFGLSHFDLVFYISFILHLNINCLIESLDSRHICRRVQDNFPQRHFSPRHYSLRHFSPKNIFPHFFP